MTAKNKETKRRKTKNEMNYRWRGRQGADHLGVKVRVFHSSAGTEQRAWSGLLSCPPSVSLGR